MSKFFYRGTPDVMGKYGKAGYQPKANVKLGSELQPLQLSAKTQARVDELEKIVAEHELFAVIELCSESEENTLELEAVLAKPQTQRFEKTPQRNEPCFCGSGKKYKKCCA